MRSWGPNLKDFSCFLSGGKGLRLSSYRCLSFLPIDLKVLLLFKDLAVQNL